MTVIKEMPFLLPFQERVLVFQSHVLKDKLVHQGETPYAVRGRSLEVSVRRNYLYEDAFDNLSPVNGKFKRWQYSFIRKFKKIRKLEFMQLVF